jgi:AcrR family transcriptional regulator
VTTPLRNRYKRPPRPNLEERKARTRAIIVDAASELFRTQGVDATSMAQISAKAETGVGTLYGYFASKDSLLREVLKKLSRESVDRYFASVTPETPHIERLLTALNFHADFLAENKVILRSAFLTGGRHEMANEFDEPLFGGFEAILRAGVDAGEFAELPLQTTARVLVSSYTMAVLQLGYFSSYRNKQRTLEDLDTLTRALVKPR